MRTINNGMRIGAFVLTLLTCAALRAATPLSVAVFDFASREESTREIGPKISALVIAQLSDDESLILVERAELEKALGEQELGLSGTVAPDTAARVGNLTAAKVLVTGSVFKSDKNLMAVAKVIGTETGRVFGTTAKGDAGSSDLSELAADLAKRIRATIHAKSDALMATVQPREEQEKHLLAQARPARPVAVSVTIPEQHFGSPAADPAAQTELLSLLQRAGFEIVDAKSDKKADIEIAGEAFSAFALRKGALNACKARLELTARRKTGGKILFNGSQTAIAADITEQTAAKTALENAALQLAERMLPVLARE